MNTQQKYEAPTSQTNAPESTSKPETSFILTLKIGPGRELEILHWALLNLREKFTEEAADLIADQDAPEYVDAMERIDHIDLLLDDMFYQLNRAYERLFDLESGRLTRHRGDDTQRSKDKAVALEVKYGWKQPLTKP